jgi:hypothetical protein
VFQRPGYDVRLPGGLPAKEDYRLDAEGHQSVETHHNTSHHTASSR